MTTKPTPTPTNSTDGIAGERLRSFVERLERLNEEIDALNGDKREIYAEAKGVGFDTKIMKEVIKLRKLDREDRQERETLLDLYMRALGMTQAPDEGFASRVRVSVHVREPATPHDPETGEIIGDNAVGTDSAASEDDADSDSAPHPFTAPGGVESEPADDDGESVIDGQPVGGAVESSCSTSGSTEGHTAQPFYTVPDDLTPAQKDGYIAHMNGEPGLAPEGYPDRRGWSQGYLRAMDDSRKASGADDAPFAVLPGAARGVVDQPNADHAVDAMASLADAVPKFLREQDQPHASDEVDFLAAS